MRQRRTSVFIFCPYKEMDKISFSSAHLIENLVDLLDLV